MKNIYVMGSGYVGLVTGACFAELGNRVTCVDIDEAKVASLSRGEMPIFEPDLEPMVRRHLDTGMLRFTTSLAEMGDAADFVFMCVGTPATDDNAADLKYLRAAYASVGENMRGRRVIVVNKSSVPPGTTDMMTVLLQRTLNGSGPARIVANPEFLREGHAVSDFMKPNRIVVGAQDRDAAEAVAELYAPLEAPLMYTDARTAEMIKFASNAFLATKLTFINELAGLCEAEGVDVIRVARGIGMDPRIGLDYLRAGLGYGGSCLPKDTAILSSQFRMHGQSPKLLDAVREVNASQSVRLIERTEKALGTLRGARVAVLGLAFKSDTDDTRHSPAIGVIQELHRRGADVVYFDPVARHRDGMFERSVEVAEGPYEASVGADAVVVATDWREFKELDLSRLRRVMRGNVLADGRNLVLPETASEAGFLYLGVGRKALAPEPEPQLVGSGLD